MRESGRKATPASPVLRTDRIDTLSQRLPAVMPILLLLQRRQPMRLVTPFRWQPRRTSSYTQGGAVRARLHAARTAFFTALGLFRRNASRSRPTYTCIAASRSNTSSLGQDELGKPPARWRRSE